MDLSPCLESCCRVSWRVLCEVDDKALEFVALIYRVFANRKNRVFSENLVSLEKSGKCLKIFPDIGISQGNLVFHRLRESEKHVW